MKRSLFATGVVAVAATVALTACSGSGSDDPGGGSGSGEGGSITVFNTKPQNPLVPANTNEDGGSNIVEAVFRGLVRYDPKTAKPVNAMAESITSSDQTNWDVKLKAGQTFQDGSPVDAKSFVDAWNWAAYGPNAAINNYFFEPIDGYDAMNPTDPDGDGPKQAPTPQAKTLTGLKQVSDTEFSVKLTQPLAVFPVMVGYHAFAPLPPSFFSDPKAFGAKPIGNGPFSFVSGNGDTGFTLKKWSGYQGEDKPHVDQLTFKTYATDTAGYNDLLAGNLDFMEQVPASALVGDQYKQDLPDRNSSTALGYIATMTLPSYDKRYDDPNLGKALSLAVNRAAIAKSVYNNGRTPATGWVSPAVDGYKAGACGQFCTYDAALAKQYLAKSAFKGPFEFDYNADGPGNQEQAEAVCNSIRNALGVECTPKAYTDFGSFRTAVVEHKTTGIIRTSWSMDYPSIQNFLEPLYVTGASANDGAYSNPQFDAAIKKANSESGSAANATYQQAETLLANDMAIVPLFYTAEQSGWSERVSDVTLTPLAFLDVTGIRLK